VCHNLTREHNPGSGLGALQHVFEVLAAPVGVAHWCIQAVLELLHLNVALFGADDLDSHSARAGDCIDSATTDAEADAQAEAAYRVAEEVTDEVGFGAGHG